MAQPCKLTAYGFLLAAAGAGGYIGFADAPHIWPTACRAAVAGIAGLAFAWGLVDFLAPLRRHLRPVTSDWAASASPPATLAAGISRLEEATAADAAQRAADDAFDIDRGEMLLTDADRWQGYRDGTATFFLAPGARLRYWWDTQVGENTPGMVFTAVTSEADAPVRITNLRQLRRLLEDYAARTTDIGSKTTHLQTA